MLKIMIAVGAFSVRLTYNTRLKVRCDWMRCGAASRVIFAATRRSKYVGSVSYASTFRLRYARQRAAPQRTALGVNGTARRRFTSDRRGSFVLMCCESCGHLDNCCMVFFSIVQSNLLKWIALGPDYEYPLRMTVHLGHPCFVLYTVFKLGQANDIHLGGFSA